MRFLLPVFFLVGLFLCGCAGKTIRTGDLPRQVVSLKQDVYWADEFFPKGSRYQVFVTSEEEKIVYLNPHILAPIGVVVDEDLCFRSGVVRSKMFSQWLWEPPVVAEGFKPTEFCFEVSN